MATVSPRLPDDAPISRLPADLPAVPRPWQLLERADRHHLERAAWVHEVTGLRVSVRDTREPTQMHTPETSRDDTGFVAMVRGESAGRLSYELASKPGAYRRAIEFMAAYPTGDFDVPPVDDQPAGGPMEWRP